MDTELFELCKEVYKRTGWDDKGNCSPLYRHYWKHHNQEDSEAVLCTYMGTIDPRDEAIKICPLYTSDYLLEKLPERTERIEDTAMLGRATNNDGWSVVYRDFVCLADTPLKALLKLTIALDDAKELSK